MEKTGHIADAKQALPLLCDGRGCLLNYAEIVKLSGTCSKTMVLFRIRKVQQKGRYDVLDSARFTPGMQVNGEVCAGFPSPAEEELRDVISFDDYLVAHPETSFLLSVTGDSMTGAGIMENDLVIIERGRQPKNGDIILAEVDGNWTMKYFYKKGRTITLEAANPGYPPIVPQTELRIAGVVTALVRKYHR